MSIWLETEEIEVPLELRAAVGGHPLVAQTLVKRGVGSPQAGRAFLDPRSYSPASPLELPGMEAAIKRLQRALQQDETICVWGDFDVDGQTSTTLLVSVLRRLGARVSYHIPVRATESHGVNLPVLKEILDGGTQLVLTCDTGISAQREVEYARSRGVDFVITDRHDLPLSPLGEGLALPAAVAIVDPKLLPGDHSLATLPGVKTRIHSSPVSRPAG